MSSPLFLFEEFFDLDFTNEWFEVRLMVGDPATILLATLWHDNRSDERREQGRLVIKTRGFVGRFDRRATAIVVRRVGKVIELPSHAGRFVGEFASKYGFHHWLVFEKHPFLTPVLPADPAPPEGAKEAAKPPPSPPTPHTQPAAAPALPLAGNGSPPAKPAEGASPWEFPDGD